MKNEYTPTIGIECHVQLKTVTKLFSGANNNARDKAPNTVVSPICFGLPGTLPILNEKAVELAVRAGAAMNCEIAKVSSFDRKHYFYPDLPKGYQITQLDRPTVGKGVIEVPKSDGTSFKVRITRAHIEEDAGKLTHPGGADYSLVDLNRAGTPLIEIVSEADMHSAEEAKLYAQELYLLMTYADVTYGDLYHGNMRFDVNVSVAKKGSDKLGLRTETKNLNSFRSVERAAEFEIKRQIEILEKGGKIKQETRGWDDAKQKTFSQRSKEDAQDYRYFPDADIPPIELEDDFIERISKDVTPNLPPAIREKLKTRGIPFKDIGTLFIYPILLDRLLATFDLANDKEFKQICNLLINVLPAEFEKDQDLDLRDSKLLRGADNLVKLAKLVNENKVSGSSAKAILAASWKEFKDPEETANEMGLIQESDESAIELVVDEVMKDPASEKAIADIKAGNDKAIGYLVGQVMKRSKGKANPALATQMIRKKL